MMNHIKVVRPLHVVLLQWAANTFGIVITMVSYLYLLPIPAAADTPEAFRRGADSLGFTAMTLEPGRPGDVADFSRAVRELADCYPLLKPRLLKAMCLAAGHDGTLSPVEREIIASTAAVMDCPLPSF